MPSFSKNDVVLVRYPFSDLSAAKVRPAIVVSASYPSQDSCIVPLTSRTAGLRPGEFVLTGWVDAGLNVPSAVKRGRYTIHSQLVLKWLGQLSQPDAKELERSLRGWLEL
jgi:mRNA interferase MazF